MLHRILLVHMVFVVIDLVVEVGRLHRCSSSTLFQDMSALIYVVVLVLGVLVAGLHAYLPGCR